LTERRYNQSEGCKSRKRAYYAKHRLRLVRNQKMRYSRNRMILNEAKDVPCADCGKRFPPRVMDFDHRDNAKAFNVGRCSVMSVARVTEEIAKCEVVCANCHRIRTWKE